MANKTVAKFTVVNETKGKKAGGADPTLTLPYPPESIKCTVNGTYASNNVLDTSNPLIRRKFSATTYKMDRLLFTSLGFTKDFTSQIEQLKTWAKAQTRLSFNYNKYNLPICYISSLDIDVRIWKEGLMAQVFVDMELIEGILEPDNGKAKPVPPNKITEREQGKVKGKVQKVIKTPAKAQKLGIKGKAAVKVSSLSQVTISHEGGDDNYDYQEFLEMTA